jgi:hypothetical protein
MQGAAWSLVSLVVVGSLACGGSARRLIPQRTGTGGSGGAGTGAAGHAGSDGGVADAMAGADGATAGAGGATAATDGATADVEASTEGGDTGADGPPDADGPMDASSLTDAVFDELTPTDAGDGSATLVNGKCVPGAFLHNNVCQCQSDVPMVCDFACTDVTTDPANCGACDRPCAPTAACNGGACGPSVTNEVPAAPGCLSLHIAFDAGALFWTDQGHGTVETQSAPGGATSISSTETRPGLITVSGSNLFWINGASAAPVGVGPPVTTTATLREASLPGGAPRDLVTETNTSGGIRGLVVSPDGKTVYYSSDTKVKSIAADAAAGSAGTVVGSEERNGIPTELAISSDGNTLAYVTDFDGDVDVITVNNADHLSASCGKLDPADPTDNALLQVHCVRIARSQGSPFFEGIILSGTNAFWSNDGAILVNAATPLATQGNQQIASTNGAPITALAGNANDIYFGQDGSIEKTPYVVNSTAIVMARAQAAPSSIALDATKVYWSTGDCAINSTVQ